MPIPVPYPEQLEVILSEHRFNVVAGSRSYGKSAVIAPLWLARQITGPGVRDREAWVAAQTFGGVRDVYWDALKELFAPALYERPRESDLSLRLVNGSRVQLVGMDRLPSRRGKRLDAFVGDEFAFLKQETWKTVRPMLTKGGKQGRALLLSSANGTNEFHDLLQKGLDGAKREPGWKSWVFDYTKAHHITADEIAAARRDMDPDSFEQEYGAKFIARSGAVYPMFARDAHVVPTAYDARFPAYFGEDFNIECQVSVMFQVVPAGKCAAHVECKKAQRETVHIPLEVVSRGVWTQDHAAKMAQVVERLGLHPQHVPVYPDATGNNRQRTSVSDVEAVQSFGFPVYSANVNPHPEDRHNVVRSFLRSADGKVRMQIDPSCQLTADSLERLPYRAGTNPPDVDKTKGLDHAPDALGYGLHYRFAPGGTVRSFRRR